MNTLSQSAVRWLISKLLACSLFDYALDFFPLVDPLIEEPSAKEASLKLATARYAFSGLKVSAKLAREYEKYFSTMTSAGVELSEGDIKDYKEALDSGFLNLLLLEHSQVPLLFGVELLRELEFFIYTIEERDLGYVGKLRDKAVEKALWWGTKCLKKGFHSLARQLFEVAGGCADADADVVSVARKQKLDHSAARDEAFKGLNSMEDLQVVMEEFDLEVRDELDPEKVILFRKQNDDGSQVIVSVADLLEFLNGQVPSRHEVVADWLFELRLFHLAAYVWQHKPGRPMSSEASHYMESQL